MRKWEERKERKKSSSLSLPLPLSQTRKEKVFSHRLNVFPSSDPTLARKDRLNLCRIIFASLLLSAFLSILLSLLSFFTFLDLMRKEGGRREERGSRSFLVPENKNVDRPTSINSLPLFPPSFFLPKKKMISLPSSSTCLKDGEKRRRIRERDERKEEREKLKRKKLERRKEK